MTRRQYYKEIALLKCRLRRKPLGFNIRSGIDASEFDLFTQSGDLIATSNDLGELHAEARHYYQSLGFPTNEHGMPLMESPQ